MEFPACLPKLADIAIGFPLLSSELGLPTPTLMDDEPWRPTVCPVRMPSDTGGSHLGNMLTVRVSVHSQSQSQGVASNLWGLSTNSYLRGAFLDPPLWPAASPPGCSSPFLVIFFCSPYPFLKLSDFFMLSSPWYFQWFTHALYRGVAQQVFME